MIPPPAPACQGQAAKTKGERMRTTIWTDVFVTTARGDFLWSRRVAQVVG